MNACITIMQLSGVLAKHTEVYIEEISSGEFNYVLATKQNKTKKMWRC